MNKELTKIYLADNQFGETDDVIESIHKAWQKNNHLGRYDFRYNAINDGGVEKLLSYLEECKWVWEVEVSERVS